MNREELQYWLEALNPHTLRPCGLYIAGRMSARALWREVAVEGLENDDIGLWRAVVVTSLDGAFPAEEYSSSKVADWAGNQAAYTVAYAARLAAGDHDPVSETVDAVFAAFELVDGPNIDFTDSERQARRALSQSLESDLGFALKTRPSNFMPLWPVGVQDPFEDLWKVSSASLSETIYWQFWIDWYQSQLDGRPVLPDSDAHWDMLAEIFEVSETSRFQEEDWEKGADHINPLIHEIYLKYLGRATYNAERIEENPETHRLRAVPETDMVPDFLRDTVDRLRDAAAIFGSPDERMNQYRSLEPEIEFLLIGVERYADRPLRLHDTAVQVVRRVETRIANEEIPSAKQDALIADFQSELLGAMQDVQSQDDRVKEVVQKRVKAKLEGATDAQVEALRTGVLQTQEITEGILKDELREDIAILADPIATPEACRQALWRLSSRLIRIDIWLRSKGGQAAAALASIGSAVYLIIQLIVGN